MTGESQEEFLLDQQNIDHDEPIVDDDDDEDNDYDKYDYLEGEQVLQAHLNAVSPGVVEAALSDGSPGILLPTAAIPGWAGYAFGIPVDNAFPDGSPGILMPAGLPDGSYRVLIVTRYGIDLVPPGTAVMISPSGAVRFPHPVDAPGFLTKLIRPKSMLTWVVGPELEVDESTGVVIVAHGVRVVVPIMTAVVMLKPGKKIGIYHPDYGQIHIQSPPPPPPTWVMPNFSVYFSWVAVVGTITFLIWMFMINDRNYRISLSEIIARRSYLHYNQVVSAFGSFCYSYLFKAPLKAYFKSFRYVDNILEPIFKEIYE